MGWFDWLKRRPNNDAESEVDPPDFREQLERAGLGRWADQLVALDLQSVRLRTQPFDDQGAIPIGKSRLGGGPDLPEGSAWPEWRGVPLAFVAQIALDEMPAIPDSGLPGAGLLSFFHEPEQRVWGFDPAERGAWRVVWSGPEETLSTRAIPDGVPKAARYRAVRLVPAIEVSHVDFESDELEALGMSPDEQLAFVEATERTDPLAHRMLGHPDTIQGDMRLECQLVSNGLYAGDTSGYDDPRAIELRPGAADWQLLLQVDSDPDARMMWGDGGRLYFWMTEDAIRRRDWDAAWMVLQCY